MKSSLQTTLLISCLIDTPLGQMIAIADEHVLYILEFSDRQNRIERAIKQLSTTTKIIVTPGNTIITELIKAELDAYFKGSLKKFKTPLHTQGTSFQKSAWTNLQNIPYGQTKSYAEQAIVVGNKSAFRAVANANGANKLSIIIPCHRIINSNGKLGGYGGGIERKQWLLNFEKQNHDK